MTRKIQINSDGTDGAWTTYDYDHRNRLIRVVERSEEAVVLNESEYRYDTGGRRIATRVNGDATYYVYSGDNVLADFDSAGKATARYLFRDEMDQMVARFEPGEGTGWYLTDKLGTPRDVIDTSGEVVSHVEFGAFGNLISRSNDAFVDRYLFTGREHEPLAGLDYFRTRFYDPRLGRFVSEDRLRFEAGDTNLFRYVGNYPIGATDPTGEGIAEFALQHRILTVTAGGAVGAALGAGSGVVIAIGCAFADEFLSTGRHPIGFEAISARSAYSGMKFGFAVGVALASGKVDPKIALLLTGYASFLTLVVDEVFRHEDCPRP